MTDRIRLDDLTSDQYDELCDRLEALQQIARGYCPDCGRGDAGPTVEDWEAERQRANQAETALARIQAIADEYPAGIDTALILAELPDRPGPAATQATEPGVFRVIALYERWVKAGPPPLGVPMSRWWDRRLVELGAALRSGEQPGPG